MTTAWTSAWATSVWIWAPYWTWAEAWATSEAAATAAEATAATAAAEETEGPSDYERMFEVMHWRRQGDLGEMSAMEWFESQGAGIYFPLGHSPHSDFIAEFGERLLRVQVKTCTAFRHGRWQVTICTRGGNQSWSGLVKYFDPSRCDYLFVVVGDGRCWCIPSSAIAGGRGICLGGPKYSEFEVERGRPLPDPHGDQPASTIGSSNARGDVRAAKGEAL